MRLPSMLVACWTVPAGAGDSVTRCDPAQTCGAGDCTACSRKLNLAWQSARPRQTTISRDERNSEPSGERHVGGIVTGDVGPKPPHVRQERYDRVPLDITP